MFSYIDGAVTFYFLYFRDHGMERLRNLIEDSDSDEDYIPRRPRWIRERNDYFDNYDDRDFAIRFRLSKEATLCLLSKIEHQLEYRSTTQQN